ncbi:hypothetical protein DRO54_03510 [Candidatus Bathyarchaeota archaeon]|nr:MAG: hypothetical protein DRO54_03510 [Candidatus Bathyarchaeota archaeon]
MENLEIDEEKLKEALKAIEKIDIKSLMNAFIGILRAYADLAKRIGKIQKDNQEAFEAMQYLGLVAPKLLQELAKKSPPAEFGVFVKTLIDLVELAPKLNNIMELSAEEKINVGERLMSIANTLDGMLKKMQEEEVEKRNV